ncbi:MAG TPA: hypothetical protein VJQ85_04025 [Gaiellaceae bacterium]|nr:hypothetical protein [Gaiellaceae bacterium]
MAHYLFNVSDREQAGRLMRAKTWPVADDERHRDALAPGDLVLIYAGAFLGRARLASAVHDGAVRLSHVEEWDPPVSMAAVVERVDPTGSNPVVQQNAAAGFRSGVVLITESEYEHARLASQGS